MVALLAPVLSKAFCGGTFLRPFSPCARPSRDLRGAVDKGLLGQHQAQWLPTDSGQAWAGDVQEILASQAAEALARAAHSSCGCPIAGRVPRQAAHGLEQAGLVQGVPALGSRVATRPFLRTPPRQAPL